MQSLDDLREKACAAVEAAANEAGLEQVRIDFLGKKGQLTDLLKGLAHLSNEDKPRMGQRINELKRDILNVLDIKSAYFQAETLKKKLASERIDVTLPVGDAVTGSIHPVTQIRCIIEDFFSARGFDILSGPEIETEFYNFEALNIPSHHPARAMHDTFYFGDGRLLRTHTSPVQIRSMEQTVPPLRLIAPGRVYRCDSDLTHTPMFHQVEGLHIDKDIHLGHLRGMLEDLFSHIFSQSVATRFRPSYFPFTEPSAEVDIQCTQCRGAGCRSCKHTGWLEVGGCGMVHPNVLKMVNISPDEYRGWAFGMGIDRLAMLYFGIDDLRVMFENDLQFLRQFV